MGRPARLERSGGSILELWMHSPAFRVLVSHEKANPGPENGFVALSECSEIRYVPQMENLFQENVGHLGHNLLFKSSYSTAISPS